MHSAPPACFTRDNSVYDQNQLTLQQILPAISYTLPTAPTNFHRMRSLREILQEALELLTDDHFESTIGTNSNAEGADPTEEQADVTKEASAKD